MRRTWRVAAADAYFQRIVALKFGMKHEYSSGEMSTVGNLATRTFVVVFPWIS